MPAPRLLALLAAALLLAAAAPAARAHAPAEGELRLPGAPADATPEQRQLAARRAATILSAVPADYRRDLARAWADPSDAFRGLDLHPSVAVGAGVLGLLYAVGVGPLRRRHGWAERVERREVLWFAGALLVLLGTLNGPIHHLSDYYLLSAHMLQHMLLAMLFPAMLLLGTPGWLLRPVVRRLRLLRLGRLLTRPVLAFGAYNAGLLLWHMPGATELVMRNHDVHIAQHLSLIALGVIGWWPVAGRLAEWPRLPYLWQIGYLFVMQIPMVAIGAFLTLAERPLYPFYEVAPRAAAWLPPLADQQLAGLLMWLPGHLVLWIPMGFIFYRWVASQSDDATGVPPVRTPAAAG